MTEDHRHEEEFVLRSGLGPPMPCPYLPGLEWRNEILLPENGLAAAIHEQLFEAGYRRVGQAFFRPVCAECRACRSLRISTSAFRRSKSQRRIWNRNRDLDVKIEALVADSEKEDLLFRYLERRHEGWETEERDEIGDSLFHDPPANCRAVVLREAGRLVGVGIVSITPNVLSSDYFFFDPADEPRSPGTFSMLWEIDHARRNGLRWYHPGFFVAGCPAMSYKARLRPAEILGRDGVWRAFDGSVDGAS